jgi:hypothetical protein
VSKRIISKSFPNLRGAGLLVFVLSNDSVRLWPFRTHWMHAVVKQSQHMLEIVASMLVRFDDNLSCNYEFLRTLRVCTRVP